MKKRFLKNSERILLALLAAFSAGVALKALYGGPTERVLGGVGKETVADPSEVVRYDVVISDETLKMRGGLDPR